MPNDPLVCAVMLVAGRDEMVRRALRSYEAQAYANKWLVVLDSGRTVGRNPVHISGMFTHVIISDQERTIGALRNCANEIACDEVRGARAEIIVTFDSDDWSHPNRIAEQVALLQSSGADAVGYSDLLFWDTRHHIDAPDHGPGMLAVKVANAAWLYTRSSHFTVPGTTLAYWRRTWEQKQFPDLPNAQCQFGEDNVWQSGLKIAAPSSIPIPPAWDLRESVMAEVQSRREYEPRMIASIHGGNTSCSYAAVGIDPSWVRAPQWDGWCRERMRLEVTK